VTLLGAFGLVHALNGCAPASPSAAAVVRVPSASTTPEAPPELPAPAAPPTAKAGDGKRVGRVTFQGNADLSRDDLLDLMHFTEHDTVEGITTQVIHDVARLRERYAERCHRTATVSDPEIRAPSGSPFVDITLRIVEGPCFRIQRLTVVDIDDKGKPLLPLGGMKLRDRFPADGAYFGDEYEGKHRDVLLLYRDAGYADVTARRFMSLDAAHETATIDVSIVRGPLVRVDSVAVTGTQRVSAERVKKAISLFPGALLNETEIEESMGRIDAIPGVGGVRCTNASVPDATHRTVTFEVIESSPETEPDPKAMLHEGEALYQAGRRAEARAKMVQVTRRYGYSAIARSAQLVVADVDFDLGSFDEAAAEYQAWARAHPDEPRVARALARAAEARAASNKRPK
jgi:hypothetical protein